MIIAVPALFVNCFEKIHFAFKRGALVAPPSIPVKLSQKDRNNPVF